MARSVLYCDETALLPLLTNRDLVDALDDDGDGEADAAAVEQCLDMACDEIDEAYLMRGVETPLDVTVEKQVGRWAKYLFVAHAYARRRMPPERSGSGAMISTIRGLLAKIAGGRMDVPSLQAAGAGASSNDGSGPVQTPGEGSVIDVVSEPSLVAGRPGRVLS